jgi:integrase
MATTPRIRVRKDGSTYSQVRYRINRDGKAVQASQSFDDHAAAIRWARLLDRVGPVEAERVLAAQLGAVADTITLKVWLHRYVDHLGKSVDEETKRKYRRMIDRDIVPFFNGEHLPVDGVTPELDAAWVEWLETEFDNAPKTIRNKHGLLCAAMGAAARQRPTPLIPWNPCAETKLPKCSAREVDHLSEDEYELVEQLLAPFWRPWWEFGVMSMARPGEQGALTVGDIDRNTGGVSITKAWKWANGRMRLGDPKTERGVRMTFVPLETVAQLDLDRPADAYLFLTPSGLPVTSVRFWQQGWAPALARLEALAAGDRTPFTGAAGWEGLSFDELCRRYGHLVGRLTSKRLTPYCTRHTGISWRLQDGEPIWVVSRDAGHSSIAITDKRYGHISAAASAASAQAVAGRLPRLRGRVLDMELARRRRLVRLGQLGEIERVAAGFEAVWMDARGLVHSQVFDTYDAAVDHVAQHEAGDLLADVA